MLENFIKSLKMFWHNIFSGKDKTSEKTEHNQCFMCCFLSSVSCLDCNLFDWRDWWRPQLVPLVPNRKLYSRPFSLTNWVSKSFQYLKSKSKPEFLRFAFGSVCIEIPACLLRTRVSLAAAEQSGSLRNAQSPGFHQSTQVCFLYWCVSVTLGGLVNIYLTNMTQKPNYWQVQQKFSGKSLLSSLEFRIKFRSKWALFWKGFCLVFVVTLFLFCFSF